LELNNEGAQKIQKKGEGLELNNKCTQKRHKRKGGILELNDKGDI
jgi:hypothetical protein